ncbi:hypothetical protein [Mucilaginibacter sp. L196]|uniref:beta strand repeat-containing protein n=1 Tax=Mucilaginibacter sp. L196 TaxID=1641870 RepID=UPI00131EC382|nr:hypothetical protein [Mucilaginibacter sp. L196]
MKDSIKIGFLICLFLLIGDVAHAQGTWLGVTGAAQYNSTTNAYRWNFGANGLFSPYDLFLKKVDSLSYVPFSYIHHQTNQRILLGDTVSYSAELYMRPDSSSSGSGAPATQLSASDILGEGFGAFEIQGGSGGFTDIAFQDGTYAQQITLPAGVAPIQVFNNNNRGMAYQSNVDFGSATVGTIIDKGYVDSLVTTSVSIAYGNGIQEVDGVVGLGGYGLTSTIATGLNGNSFTFDDRYNNFTIGNNQFQLTSGNGTISNSITSNLGGILISGNGGGFISLPSSGSGAMIQFTDRNGIGAQNTSDYSANWSTASTPNALASVKYVNAQIAASSGGGSGNYVPYSYIHTNTHNKSILIGDTTNANTALIYAQPDSSVNGNPIIMLSATNESNIGASDVEVAGGTNGYTNIEFNDGTDQEINLGGGINPILITNNNNRGAAYLGNVDFGSAIGGTLVDKTYVDSLVTASSNGGGVGSYLPLTLTIPTDVNVGSYGLGFSSIVGTHIMETGYQTTPQTYPSIGHPVDFSVINVLQDSSANVFNVIYPGGISTQVENLGSGLAPNRKTITQIIDTTGYYYKDFKEDLEITNTFNIGNATIPVIGHGSSPIEGTTLTSFDNGNGTVAFYVTPELGVVSTYTPVSPNTDTVQMNISNSGFNVFLTNGTSNPIGTQFNVSDDNDGGVGGLVYSSSVTTLQANNSGLEFNNAKDDFRIGSGISSSQLYYQGNDKFEILDNQLEWLGSAGASINAIGTELSYLTDKGSSFVSGDDTGLGLYYDGVGGSTFQSDSDKLYYSNNNIKLALGGLGANSGKFIFAGDDQFLIGDDQLSWQGSAGASINANGTSFSISSDTGTLLQIDDTGVYDGSNNYYTKLMTTVPTSSNSPGTSHEIAVDATYIYWYTGTQWLRAIGSTF